MIQRRRGASFQFETAEMIGVVAGSRPDQLQSYIASQSFVPRPKNLSHGSRADFLEDPVVTYNPIMHVEGRPAGMLGRMSIAVNNQNDRHLRPPEGGQTCPKYIRTACFRGNAAVAELSRAIIHFRLHPFEAVCDLSTGESRVNQDH
jgi:hypothetical protein